MCFNTEYGAQNDKNTALDMLKLQQEETWFYVWSSKYILVAKDKKGIANYLQQMETKKNLLQTIPQHLEEKYCNYKW